MMRALPVRIDDRPAQSQDIGIDPTLALGVIFWMSLVGLAIIAFAL